jgi:hypothetical protein
MRTKLASPAGVEAAMMRAALRLSVIGMAMALAAETASAQYVARGNDTGGIIPWSCEAEALAHEIAGAHCAAYGKFHRITSVHRLYGQYIGFNCLWRPDIARFQIPAVRTRNACVAVAVAPRLHPRVRVRY